MHGRIVRYLNSNGKGVVINASKMLFDFNKETWHDKKVMPMVGMYVEFRCNEAHQITDCKVSKFQEFGGNTMVSEADFWRYDTDEELLTLQSNARDAIVQKIYKSTDYTKIKEIPLTIKLVETIKNYFHQEFLAISFLNDLPVFEEEIFFDYTHLKRFGMKALDHLLFNDKTIAKDDFIEELSVMTRLDSAFSDFSRYNNANLQQIFQDSFLSKQCHYQALVVAVNNTKDSQNLTQKRINTLKGDILLLERRIQSNVELDKSTQKLNKLKKDLEEMLKAEKYYGGLFTHLMGMKEKFDAFYLKSFSELYQKIYIRIFKKVKSGLDICITILDNKIYHKVTKSVAFSKNFFKTPENDRIPNIIYFVEQYMEHLNKDRLNEKDALVYRYVNRVCKKHRKYFLVISTNEKRATEIKLKILEQNKFNVVKTAYKNTIYFTMVNEIHFDCIYIDPENVWKSPNEFIREIKALKANENTKFSILPGSVKENRFGFTE
ncbi:hypothetical protein [Helicobacter sp.]|uniref:hypothetical protein n=1 Tax=Helicobacter sp. TaxID=218 RepID=UPI0025C02FCA|nr:hypothetical protein [Helicobacter sp.]MCI5969513.1 hypothetical protein [Helicobacter sp.]MDY2584781.1 hypothetical protein [Helicobacter sp.]